MLLYWDHVGTIVPYDLAKSRVRLGDYTFELIKEGLVRSVFPDAYTYKIPRFADDFVELLARDDEASERRRVAFKRGETTLIHVDKMGWDIGNGLKEDGLAHAAGGENEPNSWWHVESSTANAFMTYLATALGAVEELEMDPVTDSRELFVQSSESALGRAEELRLGVLEAVLPGPVAPVPPNELKSFRTQHRDRLAEFHSLIEEELLTIALIDEDDARQRRKQQVEDRLRREIADIVARMQERRWPKVVFGTVCGVAAVGVGAGLAVATGGPAIALAVPGVVKGAYELVEGITKRDTSHSPVAYAALVEKQFGSS